MTADEFKKKTTDSLIQDMRKGILILKADKVYPNDPTFYEVIDINRSVVDMMGIKNETIIGKKIVEVVNLKKADLKALNDVMNTGISQQFEYYVKRLDEWLLIAIHHSQHDLLTVAFENITEKKKIEQKLIESEETMRLTLEVTGEGVWEWLADGRVKHNRKWCHILGLAESDLTHDVDTYMERIYPDDREIVMTMLRNAIETQDIFHHKYRMVRADGRVIWVEDRGVAVVGPDKKFDRMIGSMNEITDFVETQQHLNKEKELLRSTLLSVGDGIIATDVQGNITIINPVAEEFSGWQHTEAIGKNIADVFQMVDPETKKSLYCFNLSESKENRHQKIQNKQASVTTRYGEKYVMDSSISPIRLSNNQLTGFVITFRDVTEVVRYQREIEFMSYHDDLTGLYNRRYVMEALNRLDKKENLPLTLMVVDINYLKETNDQYGHAVGDQLIRKTATILKAFFWETAIISRTGGDEFLILLPETTEEQAEELKKQIHGEMENFELKNTPLSVAVGYATKHHIEENVEKILRIADDNMYQNKVECKNGEE